MASNNSSEYKVVADKIVSPDEDIIFRVNGALYMNSVSDENRITTVADIEGFSGGSALNYAQQAGTSVTVSNVGAVITGVEMMTTGKPVQISVTGEAANAEAESWIVIQLMDGPNPIGNAIQLEASAVSENVPYALNFIHTAEEGGHDFHLKVVDKSDTGNWVFGEAGGPVFNAVELTGFKGDDGDGADIADFVFDIVEDETFESRITVANHDMIIRTTRTDDEDADISLNSADDIWLNAGDEIEIDANSTILLRANEGIFLNDQFEPNNQIATIGDIQGASTADFVFDTVEAPDYESTMTVTNNDMVIKTVVDTEANGNIRVESAQDIVLNAQGGAYIGNDEDESNRIATMGDISSAGTGDITFVDNTISSDTGDDIVIENKNDDGIVKARITLDQSNEQVLIEAMSTDSEWFNDTQWADATWSGNTVTINNTPDIINFFNNLNGDVTSVSINDGTPVEYDGSGYGPENIGINVIGTPSEDPLTVTTIRFYYSQSSRINIDNDDNEFDIISMNMSINIDSSGDLQLTARDEDIDLNARDDIRFTANWDTDGTAAEWRMTNTGRFELPGDGYISNPDNSSGDGSGYDTLHLVPDSDLLNNEYHEDQYLIIDPTAPNHIHIRAGGEQDASNANLFLGAERTNVVVSDGGRNVGITTRPALVINTYLNINPENGTNFVTGSTADIQIGYTVNVDGIDYVVDTINAIDEGVVAVTANGAVFNTAQGYTFRFEPFWDNNWTFGSDGVLSGPAMGGVKVPAIANSVNGNDLYVYATGANVNIEANDGEVTISAPEINITSNAAPSSLNINTYSGAIVNSARTSTYADEDKIVATLGDIVQAIETGPTETLFTVNGGTTATQPTFNGSPLFSGTYVKTGPMVHFQIQVDMDNITNFGTGQYYVDLPFDAKYGYQFKEGCLHHIATSNQYAIGGHVAAGTNRLYLTYTGSNGQDEMFDYNSPVTLASTDNFHIAGTFITN